MNTNKKGEVAYKDKNKKREYGREYYSKNKEKYAKYKIEHNLLHPEIRKEYYQKNKERIRAYYKKWFFKNRRILKIKQHEHYLKNKDAISKMHKFYREKNRDRLVKLAKEWALNHPMKSKRIKLNWYLKNRNMGKINKSQYKKTLEEGRRNRELLKRNHPNIYRARYLAHCKIKIPTGCLCQICNKNLAVERHHTDYRKPLYVILICKDCHNKTKRKYP